MVEAVMPGPEVLVKMRRVMKLQLAAVAQRSGVNVSVLSRWENGKGELSADQIDAVARVIHEESWKRSEEGTLPKATDVSASCIERGKQFRAKRLEWGVRQVRLSEATELPYNLISMWENGYITINDDEEAQLNDALQLAISTKSAMLAWYLNPRELQCRREALGVSRKRLARATGHGEDWLTKVEAGEIALDEDTSTPLWEYLATLEIEQGKQADLRAALRAPVRMEPDEPQLRPITFAKQERMAALKKKVGVQAAQIVELRKIADIAQEMNRNSSEANVLLTHVVGEVEEKIAAMQQTVSQMPPSTERTQFVKFLTELVEVIEQ